MSHSSMLVSSIFIYFSANKNVENVADSTLVASQNETEAPVVLLLGNYKTF